MKKSLMYILIVAIVIVSVHMPILAVGVNFPETASLTEVYNGSAAIAKCGPLPGVDLTTVSFYAPQAKSKQQVYTKVTTMQGATFMCMLTSLGQYKANGGYGWVAMAPGSQVGYTTDGQAYYLGTPDGQYLRCHNHIVGIFEQGKVQESYTMGGSTPQVNVSAQATAVAEAKQCVPYEFPESTGRTIKKNGKEYEVYSNGCGGFSYLPIEAEKPPVEKEKKKSWWAKNWGWVVGIGAAIGVTAVVLARDDDKECPDCDFHDCDKVHPAKTHDEWSKPRRTGVANGGRINTGNFPVGTVGFCDRPRIGQPNELCEQLPNGQIRRTGRTTTSTTGYTVLGNTTSTTSTNGRINRPLGFVDDGSQIGGSSNQTQSSSNKRKCFYDPNQGNKLVCN